MSKGKENKPHIGIFGRRNQGKSSLINRLAGQDIAIVSEVPGTTTDPVRKSMEIPGIGAVVLIDTAGIDDVGGLGGMRVRKSLEVLQTVDMAMLLLGGNKLEAPEEYLLQQFQDQGIPFLLVHHKSDIQPLEAAFVDKLARAYNTTVIPFSSMSGESTAPLVDQIKALIPESAYTAGMLLGDLLSYGDVVLLITPIDMEAPEGRLILPQVQVIRDVLDHDGIAVVCKEREVDAYIRKMQPRPKLVVTDSQVFPKADAAIPRDIPLTSFSILLARQKGDFDNYLKGTPAISRLKDGDKVLILESCTHHTSCDDIGRVKIPRWLSQFTGKNLYFETVAGLSPLPENLRDFALVIQCGGCVITRRQVLNRVRMAVNAGIPVTNYGMAIAYVHGIYRRAIEPFTKNSSEAGDYL